MSHAEENKFSFSWQNCEKKSAVFIQGYTLDINIVFDWDLTGVRTKRWTIFSLPLLNIYVGVHFSTALKNVIRKRLQEICFRNLGGDFRFF